MVLGFQQYYYLLLLSQLPKILLHEGGAFVVEDAADGVDLMIQPLVFRDRVERAAGAGFNIIRTENESRNAGEDDRTGTHRARLDRHIECGVNQVSAFERSAGGGDCHHFGVGRCVFHLLGQVVSLRNDAILLDDHAADRHLAKIERLLRFSERHAHPILVVALGKQFAG